MRVNKHLGQTLKKFRKEALTVKKSKKRMLVWLLVVCMALTQTIFTGIASAATTAQSRLSGHDRYKTAVAISQKGWKVSQYAVLARGDDFADALCAGPLARKYNAPILLTQTEGLNADVLTELKRLDVKNVFIIGGTGAVSSSVEDALTAAGMKNERIFGADRYETSVKVAEKLGTVSSIVLATGLDYPDALSISPVAANMGMPILLSEKDSLPGRVIQYLTGRQITQTYVIGGTGVLSDTVKNAVPNPVRIGGNDRFETNTLVMKQFESKLNFRELYVAIGDGPSGDEFADALTGAVLAANTASPVILTGKVLPDITGNYIKAKVALGSKVTALGGEAVVPPAVLDSINAYIAAIPVKVSYDKAGTYGPETGIETVTGNVVISVPDVILQNTLIKGDLLLAEGIGNGNATLRNVTVEGTTIVKGGGPNSVVLYNFNGTTVRVDVPDGGNVRIVTQGSTDIGATDIVIPEGATVTLDGSFGEVNVESAGAHVNTQNGTLDSLNITASGVTVNVLSGTVTSLAVGEDAQGSIVNINSGARVTTLEANAPVDVTGGGSIETANIKSNGVTIEQTPTNVNIDNGLTATINGEIVNGSELPAAPPTGGGGGGGGIIVPTIIQGSWEATGNIGTNNGKVYKEFKLKADSNVISLKQGDVTSINVLKPGATSAETLQANTDSTLWFNVQNVSGQYKYTIVANGITYEALLNWSLIDYINGGNFNPYQWDNGGEVVTGWTFGGNFEGKTLADIGYIIARVYDASGKLLATNQAKAKLFTDYPTTAGFSGVFAESQTAADDSDPYWTYSNWTAGTPAKVVFTVADKLGNVCVDEVSLSGIDKSKCIVESQDNQDGSATFTMTILDVDGNPVNGLVMSDFATVYQGHSYTWGLTEQYISDFQYNGNGVYTAVYSHFVSNPTIWSGFGISVKGVTIISDLEVTLSKKVIHTQADFAAFDGIDVGTNSYTISSHVTATYTGNNTIKLTGNAPIVTPWFGQNWTTYNFVTVGIKLPVGFIGECVYQTGIMRYDDPSKPEGYYKMSAVGDGSTPLATSGAAKGYLDFSFAANSNSTKKNGLVKLMVVWNENNEPEYFTIDINELELAEPDPIVP